MAGGVSPNQATSGHQSISRFRAEAVSATVSLYKEIHNLLLDASLW